jgi:hypothetical protein
MTTTLRYFRKAALPVCAMALAFAASFSSLAQSQQPAAGDGVVTGVVREAGTDRPVGSVRVTVAGTRIATLSRSDGRFVLQGVPAGDHTLLAASVGYVEGRSENVSVRSGTTTVADVKLEAIAISIEGIVVTPGRFGVMQENAGAPQAMGREMIETMPGLGEDIYRMVHRLPGVAADDYSAKFAVRGGGHDELLVRLDGLTLFEPFHLKDLDGALSIVDVQAVGGVDLTTGGFTAEHGNRLTGVFDMRTLREPGERTRTSAGISLTNARLMSVGGFDENRGHWLVSARRGYLDVLLKMVDPEGGFTPRYHDVLAKVGYELSPRHTVSVNVLTSGDALTMSDDLFTLRSTYGNHYAWLNWRAYPGATVSVQTVLSVGRLDWMRKVDGGAAGTEITELALDDRRDFGFGGLQHDWSWRASDRQLLKWGAGVRSSRASYEYERSQDGVVGGGGLHPVTGIDRSVVAPSAVEAGGYLTHRLRLDRGRARGPERAAWTRPAPLHPAGARLPAHGPLEPVVVVADAERPTVHQLLDRHHHAARRLAGAHVRLRGTVR